MSSANPNSAQTSEPKRASMACLHCRGKKLKCSLENGETRCKNCIRSNIQCIFAPVNNEQGTKSTQSNQGPYITQQFRLERPTAYTTQHNAQPTQPSVHSWSLHGGNAVAAPPPPTPQRPPAPQRAPAYQGPATIQPQYPSYETYTPPGQYDPYALQQSQQQHGQQATQMYRFVDDSYPRSWVPGQPSNYPNQGTVFPAQFGDPQQSMSAPASSSIHPQYGHADPNIPWNAENSTNFYYPEQNDNDQQPFDGQGPF